MRGRIKTKKKKTQWKVWRKAVFDRDGSKCVKCGSYKDIQAHHKLSWALWPEKRFDVENGQTLCRSCHIEIHPFMAEYDIKRGLFKAKRQNVKAHRKVVKKKKKKWYKPKAKKKPYDDYRFTKDRPNPNWTS